MKKTASLINKNNLIHNKLQSKYLFQSHSFKKFCSTSNSFQNQIPISTSNFIINKKLTHLELQLDKLKTEIPNKKFLFEKNVKVEEILQALNKEYDLVFKIDNNSIQEIVSLLKEETLDDEKAPKNVSSLSTQLEMIKQKLGIQITDKEYDDFLNIFKQKNSEDMKELKRKYFFICSQIEDMDNIKQLINRKVTFRINVVFLMIIAFLTTVTAVFYYCIYNVDELGWDLVEPTTYLFSSIIFLGCLFGYIKLQKRGLYSTNYLYSELKNELNRKRYLMYNFNINRYEELIKKKAIIHKEIEKLGRL